MSTFLVPIVVITLAISSLFILAWLVYPFLLRYRIENAFGLFNSNLQNGANGKNGAPGENAPEIRNGSNGVHGANSQAGKNGANGLPGQRGIQGVAGHDGDGGEDGEDGEDGVPGFGVVQVCSKMFDPTSKNLYYVNGNPIDSHVDSLATKVTKTFNDQKLRLKDRIQNSFKLDSDKIHFTAVLDKILETTPLSGTSNKLDSLDLFNAFLDTVKNKFILESATLKTTKDSELVLIEKFNSYLKNLRVKRDVDLATLDSSAFKKAVRASKLSFLLSSTDGDFTTKINNLISNTHPELTIDNVISDLTSEINTFQNTFNSPDSTSIQKTTASQKISTKTGQINSLKNIKTLITAEINIHKNNILNAYKEGDNISLLPHFGVNFSDYSDTFIIAKGADQFKDAIVNSNNNINTAITNCQINMEATILPYRTANP